MLERFNKFLAGIAALLVVTAPAWAFAAPPPAEAEQVAEGASAGVMTKQWWMEKVGRVLSEDAMDLGVGLAKALGLFIVGWLVAKIVSWAVYRWLRKASWDDKLADKLGIKALLEERDGKTDEDGVERAAANMVYYLAMALVVVGVLQLAGLEQAAGPIQGFVDTIVQALPLVGKAVVILVVAYFAGWILRKGVIRVLGIKGFEKRLAELESQDEGEADDEGQPMSETAGEVVFWLVMIMGIAGAFDALQISAISEPLSNAIDSLISVLPALGIAALIGVGGWIMSKISRAVVTRALESLGFDKLVAKVKLDGLFGSSTPSKVAGWLAMAFVLVQTAIAALDRVGLSTLSEPMTDMMGQFWDLLPALLISALFIVVGVFVGRLLRGIARHTLEGVGFDKLMDRLGFGTIAERDDDLAKPSGFVGFVIQAGIVLLAIVQGLNNLGLDSWAGYVDAFLVFSVTRAAVAMLIVGVGFTIGNYVRDLIEARQRGEQPLPTPAEGEAEGEAATPEPVWMAEFARYTVLVFAFTMAVHQLGVAEDFVLLSFALLFGALCLAGALAFGLGAKDVASEIVRDRYRKAKQGGPAKPGAKGGSLFGKPSGK